MKAKTKMTMKKIIAAVSGAAMLIQAQVPTFVKAAEPPQYISEVYLSYGNTPEEAKAWLLSNGYNVLNQDLNEGAESAQWASTLLLASDKRSVYLGFKTTTEKDEAITDMRAMNMNGDFSYEAYEKMLKDRREMISALVEDAKAALAEYRANYNAGLERAVLAHDMLNKMTDDDSDNAPLGDLFLKPVKEEVTAAEYETDPKKYADMTTIILQGNSDAVKLMMEYLSYAADTGKGTWLERLGKSGGIDDIFERYEKEYPSLSESKLTKLIQSDYDEDAKTISYCIEDLREGMKIYTESGLTGDSDEAAVNAYFNEHKELNKVSWASAALIYEQLKEIKFEDTTLSEFIMDESNDFSDPEGRLPLYTIADSLSDGQRSLLSYVALSELIYTGGLDDDGWSKFKAEMEKTYSDQKAKSIYSCVDRSAFQPGGVALTSEARTLRDATGTQIDDGIFGVGLDWMPFACYGATAVTLIMGISTYKYGSALEKPVLEAQKKANEIHAEIMKVHNDMQKNLKDYIRNQKEIGEDLEQSFSEMLNNNNNEIIDLKDFPDLSESSSILGDKQKYIQMVEVDGKEVEYIQMQFLKNGRVKQLFKPLDEVDLNDLPSEMRNDINSQNNALWDQMDDLNKKLEDIDGVTIDNEGGVNIEHQELINNNYKTMGAYLCLAAMLLAVVSAGITIYEVYQYYHQDLAPIPRVMVNESSDAHGRSVYTYYSCVLCNRTEQGFKNEKLGDYGDMNGDVGKQWLALYTTKDKAAGDPITADILAQKGSNNMPLDKATGIRLFGKTDTVNLVSEEYCYNDKLGGLYIFCGTEASDKAAEKPSETPAAAETAPASSESAPEETKASEVTVSPANGAKEQQTGSTGSVVGTGSLVMTSVLSAAFGALICFLLSRKKHEDSTAA